MRLIRAPLAATAAFDSTACLLLGLRLAERSPASIEVSDWILLALTSLLIYSAGMAANDLADRRLDRRKHPGRPLPRGVLSPLGAALGVGGLAAAALWLGGGPAGHTGTVAVALVLAGLYDFALKRFLVAGAVAMGAVRMANASLGLWPLLARRPEAWPVLFAPLLIGLYAAGVTVLSTTEDVQAPRRLAVARALAALAFAGAAALSWILGGLPTLGVAVAFGVASSTIFGRTPRPGPARKQVLEMLLGLYWLAAVLAGGGHAGTLESAVLYSFFALVLAWILVLGSQLWIRALAPRGSP